MRLIFRRATFRRQAFCTSVAACFLVYILPTLSFKSSTVSLILLKPTVAVAMAVRRVSAVFSMSFRRDPASCAMARRAPSSSILRSMSAFSMFPTHLLRGSSLSAKGTQ